MFLKPALKNKKSIILQGHFYPGSAGFDSLQLEKTLPYLNKHYSIVTVSENLKQLKEGNIPSKPLLSFAIDDFGKGFTKYSYPYFKQHHIPFTLGVCPGLIPEINDSLSTFDKTRIKRNQNVSFITDTLSNLKELINEHQVEICSHTTSHSLLSELKDSELSFEITKSKMLLEHNLDKPVSGFIFPFGYSNLVTSKVIRVLNESSFEYALTTEKGMVTRNQQWNIRRMNGDLDFNATRVNATFLWSTLKEK